MKEQASVQNADATADLYKFTTFLGAAFGLMLYLQLLQNRQYWVIMEVVLGVVSLLLFPFASTVIPNYFTDGVDSLAIYLFRIMVLARVGQSVVIYLTRNSHDPTVGISVSITNALSRGMLLISALHGIYYTKTVSNTSLKIDFVTLSLLMIGDLFHMSKLSTRDGNLTIGDPISFHLSVDALLTFMLGAWTLGFPDMFLNIINPGIIPKEGHLALARVIGCFVCGGSVLSFASLCFKDTDDAIATLKSKIVVYVPAILIGFVNYLTNQQYRGLAHGCLVTGSMGILAVNAGYALWQNQKKKLD